MCMLHTLCREHTNCERVNRCISSRKFHGYKFVKWSCQDPLDWTRVVILNGGSRTWATWLYTWTSPNYGSGSRYHSKSTRCVHGTDVECSASCADVSHTEKASRLRSTGDLQIQESPAAKISPRGAHAKQHGSGVTEYSTRISIPNRRPSQPVEESCGRGGSLAGPSIPYIPKTRSAGLPPSLANAERRRDTESLRRPCRP